MRSKALSFLLSLSLMFCVGFGSSLTASAYTGDGATVFPLLFHNSPHFFIRGTNWNDVYFSGSTELISSQNAYYIDSPSFSGVGSLSWLNQGSQLDFNFSQDLYDYYFTLTVNGFSTNSSDLSFYPDEFYALTCTDLNDFISSPFNNISIYHHDDTDSLGFTITGKLPFLSNTNIYGLELLDFDGGSVPSKLRLEGFIVAFPKGQQVGFNDVISAINNQTGQLGGIIDSAADDIQQSIEDQYGGDPGSSFPVDDIITQHNEKMGVLSFSSEALMQVLGLLSPDQTLSSELVFPSMSLTIAGQRNKVQLWPEYRFDLNTLKQHWPDFVGIMQSLTTALVWIFVLRYCYRVFEKYFLAGGGS